MRGYRLCDYAVIISNYFLPKLKSLQSHWGLATLIALCTNGTRMIENGGLSFGFMTQGWATISIHKSLQTSVHLHHIHIHASYIFIKETRKFTYCASQTYCPFLWCPSITLLMMSVMHYPKNKMVLSSSCVFILVFCTDNMDISFYCAITQAHTLIHTLWFRLRAPREQSLDYTTGEGTPHDVCLGKPLCCALQQ